MSSSNAPQPQLQSWSTDNPNHDVITLYLDLKHTTSDDFPSRLDEYIRQSFHVEKYSPIKLMGTASSLSQGALDNGWSTLDELKGKFIICLTGNEKDKAKYAITEPAKRLCFADKDIDNNEMPSDNHRVFFNFHIFHNKREQWMDIFKQCANKPNVITRAYIADSEDNWNDSLSSGCNLIATDKISNHEWAKVGDSRFVELK